MKCSPSLIHSLSWLGAAFLFTSVAVGQEKDPAGPDNAPIFESASSDPVLLRYKLKTGQALKMVVDTDAEVQVNVGGQQLKLQQTRRIEAKAVITAVDDEGNLAAVTKITRLQMKNSGLGTVEFDTDKPGDDPKFKAVLAMINVGIPCKLSAVGKILETDLEPLRLAARRADSAALTKVLEESTSKMFEGTFVHLSESPVKAGDTYKAGTIVEDKTRIHMSYKIRSVSGDASRAVIEPVAVMEVGPGAFPDADATIKDQRMSGWILYDVQKGYVSQADVRMHMLLDLKAMGETGTVEVTGKSVLKTTLD